MCTITPYQAKLIDEIEIALSQARSMVRNHPVNAAKACTVAYDKLNMLAADRLLQIRYPEKKVG